MSKDRRKVKRDLNRWQSANKKDQRLHYYNTLEHTLLSQTNDMIYRIKERLTEKNCCRYFGWF